MNNKNVNHILSLAKTIKKNIIFPEGKNILIQQAAHQIATEWKATCQLVFNKTNEVPTNLHPRIKVFILEKIDLTPWIEKLYSIRQSKWTKSEAATFIKDPYYFAFTVLASGDSDGLIGGIDCSTAKIARASFQVVGVTSSHKIATSAFLLNKKDQFYIFSDCAFIPERDVNQLVIIGQNAASFAEMIGFTDVRLAFLSFSTNKSGGDFPSVVKVRTATENFNNSKNKRNNWDAIGEVQFDTAFSHLVRQKKLPTNSWKTPANVYIFPDLDSGNIGYKIAQRLGGFSAYGPIILGLKKPVCDLSRGATLEDIIGSTLLTISVTNKTQI